jgi:tetratricopeptide (TPR) repeat protein
MKQYDKELDVLRQSQRLAPDNPNVLKGLMVNFFMIRQYDSAVAYAQQIFARDSSPDAVYILGFSAFQMRQGTAAESYFKKYLEIGDDDRKLKQVADFLERLKEMKAQNIGLR